MPETVSGHPGVIQDMPETTPPPPPGAVRIKVLKAVPDPPDTKDKMLETLLGTPGIKENMSETVPGPRRQSGHV